MKADLSVNSRRIGETITFSRYQPEPSFSEWWPIRIFWICPISGASILKVSFCKEIHDGKECSSLLSQLYLVAFECIGFTLENDLFGFAVQAVHLDKDVRIGTRMQLVSSEYGDFVGNHCEERRTRREESLSADPTYLWICVC